MNATPTIPGSAVRSLLKIDAARLLRFAEAISARDFQGETFESCHISGELRQIASDLAGMVADVEALEKRP